MKVLDLFCGLGGWSETWKRAGHDVTTLDIDPRFRADIVDDVRKVRFERGAFDVILASPPCELFSTAGWHRHAWRMSGDKKLGTNRYVPTKPEARTALSLVNAARAIIEEVEPFAAVIENPRGLLRQLPPVRGLPRATVWYCHYGEKRAKPTDLWLFGAARSLRLKPECHNQRLEHPASCCCFDHNPAPRGSLTGTQGMESIIAAKIPAQLALAVRRDLEGRK